MFCSISLVVLFFASRVNSIYHVQSSFKEDCNCYCPESSINEETICQKISKFEKELSTVKDAIEYRTRYIHQINDLKEKLDWQEYVIERMSKQMESFSKFVAENPDALKPEALPLTMNPEDEMQNDGGLRNPRIKDSGVDLVKNMTNLLAKVEVVENITLEVQEELESERRVRRHIEHDLSEARSSIKMLGDKFTNFSIPSDVRLSQVEEIVITSFESMNKTFFEDYLQKLYYKVDGDVYKNETRKLVERLDTVEAELHLDSNASMIQKISDDLRNVTDILINLNESVMEKRVSDDTRLEIIESKTSEIDELKNLTHKIGILSNTSDLMQSGLSDLWNNMKNETMNIRSELESRLEQVENSTTSGYRVLTNDVAALKWNISQAEQSVFNIQTEMSVLSADVHLVEEKLLDTATLLDTGFRETDAKLHKMTEDWRKALDLKTRDLLKKGDKRFEQIKMDQNTTDVLDFEDDYKSKFGYDISAGDEDDIDGIISFRNKENEACSIPTTDDEHLRITLEEGEDGEQQLLFVCLPIGQYVLSEEETEKIECLRGEWQGSFPTCRKLLTGEEMKAEILKDLIPSIMIDPDNVDKANGLMGTNSFGHLVVYPGTSFKLRCLYPDNMWGLPKWNKDDAPFPANHLTVLITSASSEDSGVYSCVTPFGKQHSLTIAVEAISCPEFDSASLHGLSAFYRPHPEGMIRILSTQALFKCDNGETIASTCLADGQWSRMPPTEQECPTQDSGMPWNCPFLDISSKPNLVLHPVKPYTDKIVMFNCTRNTHKTGSPFTRCKSDGNWSHRELPDCLPN